MSVIGIVSMKGGVGKTTITANLSTALAELLGQGRVSVVDLDPQNALRWHLGLNEGIVEGLATSGANEPGHWGSIAIESPFGVRCLPYGEAQEEERLQFESVLNECPDWLSEHIRVAGLDEDAVVLIDTPPGPSTYLRQVYQCADLVVVVVLADAASYASVTAMESWRAELPDDLPPVKTLYLLNQVDRSDLLNKDVADILRQRMPDALIPLEVHQDESVREALAFQQPVMVYNAHGQASHDLAHLAEFLIDTLNQ